MLRLTCTKSLVGWGSASDPSGGAYSAPRPPSWILGSLYSLGWDGGKNGRGWEGRREEGSFVTPPASHYT